MKLGYSFDKQKHVHFLDGRPLIGTTTALSVLGKELTWWASGMAVGEMGWSNAKKVPAPDRVKKAKEMLDKIKEMDEFAYLGLLDNAYKAHNARKETAKDAGIDRHAEIEAYIKARMQGIENPIVSKEIEPFHYWALKNVKRFLFTELHCYSKLLYCGGIADFGFENMGGDIVLGDLKSSREPYFNQWAQLGGYDIQISENGGYTHDGKKTFVLPKDISMYAIFCAGHKLDEPFYQLRLGSLKKSFIHSINLYREKLFFENGGKNGF